MRYAFAILIVLALVAATPKPKPKPQPRLGERAVERFTRLRVEGQPYMLWRKTKTLRLESMQVTVRNVGQSSAEKVRVLAQIPGGKKLQLKGPASLAVGESAPYTSGAKEMVYGAGDVRFAASCRNCRKE